MKRGHAFHLHLFNADDPECARCHSNSSLFEIAQPGSDSSDDSPSTDSPAASAASATSKSDAEADPSQTLPLGLGLGLGLGIPLLVFMTAFATWLCMRRKRRKGQDDSSHPREVVDYEQRYWQRQDAKTEMQGQAIGELPDLGNVVEAPTSMHTVELEGTLGHFQR